MSLRTHLPSSQGVDTMVTLPTGDESFSPGNVNGKRPSSSLVDAMGESKRTKPSTDESIDRQSPTSDSEEPKPKSMIVLRTTYLPSSSPSASASPKLRSLPDNSPDSLALLVEASLANQRAQLILSSFSPHQDQVNDEGFNLLDVSPVSPSWV
ncbi:hypothetical protein AZE42_10200 [Rhizopogon vesiculosus]|uniref:Uncharacterized protein n=1 Tax=Rhizopogon vesiculosus TaxID=180088 RepID=A0A1J8PGY1_9AGAM|nr:hypothetical protein AZE42_10200 [Rhizopogon vesiculosus]